MTWHAFKSAYQGALTHPFIASEYMLTINVMSFSWIKVTQLVFSMEQSKGELRCVCKLQCPFQATWMYKSNVKELGEEELYFLTVKLIASWQMSCSYDIAKIKFIRKDESKSISLFYKCQKLMCIINLVLLSVFEMASFRDWVSSQVNKVFATHVWGPEFEFSELRKRARYRNTCINFPCLEDRHRKLSEAS